MVINGVYDAISAHKPLTGADKPITSAENLVNVISQELEHLTDAAGKWGLHVLLISIAYSGTWKSLTFHIPHHILCKRTWI